jgi:hypothetical protein
MKRSIKITFNIDYDEPESIDIIIDYLSNEIPSVIGEEDNVVIVNSMEFKKLD